MPVKIKTPDWDNIDKFKNQELVFEAIYRQRQNARKRYNPRSNPRVIKTLRIRDTKNRALLKIAKLADNSTVRSLDIKLVGITKNKKKDIKVPQILKNKFRSKKSKNSRVLRLVEKSKYTIDKIGEKRALQKLKK